MSTKLDHRFKPPLDWSEKISVELERREIDDLLYALLNPREFCDPNETDRGKRLDTLADKLRDLFYSGR